MNDKQETQVEEQATESKRAKCDICGQDLDEPEQDGNCILMHSYCWKMLLLGIHGGSSKVTYSS